MNAKRPQWVAPLLCAACQGHAATVLSMVLSGANPDRQGSCWQTFMLAATPKFTQDMAEAFHIMMNTPSLLPVSRPLDPMHDLLPLLEAKFGGKITTDLVHSALSDCVQHHDGL